MLGLARSLSKMLKFHLVINYYYKFNELNKHENITTCHQYFDSSYSHTSVLLNIVINMNAPTYKIVICQQYNRRRLE